MKLIDRYIVRTFLLNFVILLAVLMTLFVLIDLLGDVGDFIKVAHVWSRQEAAAAAANAFGIDGQRLHGLLERPLSASQLLQQFPRLGDLEQAEALRQQIEPGALRWWFELGRAIFDYYGPMVVLLYVFFSSLIVVGAMGFTLSGMLRSQELTALISSGVSLYRVAVPLLVAGIALNALTMPIQELVIPGIAHKLARSKSKITNDANRTFPLDFVVDDQGNLFTAAEFDGNQNELRGLTVLIRDPATGLAIERIFARSAEWWEAGVDAAGQPHPAGWRFPPNTYKTRAPMGVGEGAIAVGEAMPEEVHFFPSQLSPTVLLARRASLYARLLSMSELQAMQQNEAVDASQRRRISQTIWSRFSLVVIGVLMLTMGLPFFLLRSPENMLLQGVKVAGLCMAAWGGGLMMLQVTSDVMPPLAMAWLPVVLYLPLSVWLLQRVET